MKKLTIFLSLLCLTMALTTPASAAEYTIHPPDGPDYGAPTSIEPIATANNGERPNQDLSKNAALIPPVFGSPTSYLLNSGLPLTPNLTGSGLAASSDAINGSSAPVLSPGSAVAPATSAAPAYPAFTSVTSDLYYSGGHLGTLKISKLNLSVKIYQGTGNATLAKGVGHFTDTSIWDGNVALAAHNRGTNNYFGSIHTLKAGDEITLTTKLGTRTYAVTSVEKVLETDNSMLVSTADNELTLITCVRDEREARWCVRAVQTG